jgi:hypothetical protein
VIGGMDRNGLRPMRYTITADWLLIGGSETGMVKVDEAQVVEKGRLGPGKMIAVDLMAGKLYHDTEIKDGRPSRKSPSNWRKRRGSTAAPGLSPSSGSRCRSHGSATSWSGRWSSCLPMGNSSIRFP